MKKQQNKTYFEGLRQMSKKFKTSEGKKPYKRLRKQDINTEYWEEVYELLSCR